MSLLYQTPKMRQGFGGRGERTKPRKGQAAAAVGRGTAVGEGRLGRWRKSKPSGGPGTGTGAIRCEGLMPSQLSAPQAQCAFALRLSRSGAARRLRFSSQRRRCPPQPLPRAPPPTLPSVSGFLWR